MEKFIGRIITVTTITLLLPVYLIVYILGFAISSVKHFYTLGIKEGK